MLEFIGNHPLLVGGTLAMILAAIMFEIRVRARAIFELAPNDAVKLINGGANVIDLRAAERYQAGHIVDAINMTPAALGKGEDKRIKKKRPVLVVCENGGDSVKAAATLRQAGLEMSFCIKGGIDAWTRENLPLVTARKPGGK